MAAPRFRFLRKFITTRWLSEGEGELVGYSLGIQLDAYLDRLWLGLLARFPQNGPNGETAPTDALAAMGRDRREIRGIGESAASYAAHLLTWLDDRRRQGNPFMLMQKLHHYVGPAASFRTVDMRGNWYSRAADGTETSLLKQENWDWDGTPIGEKWSRFWVICYPGGVWSEGSYEWGDPGLEWGDAGETWGTTAPLVQIETLRALVADWMPAGTRCVNIILAFDANSFDPTAPEPNGLWGSWSERLTTARYLEGVSR